MMRACTNFHNISPLFTGSAGKKVMQAYITVAYRACGSTRAGLRPARTNVIGVRKKDVKTKPDRDSDRAGLASHLIVNRTARAICAQAVYAAAACKLIGSSRS
jgi:hypothetical protein